MSPHTVNSGLPLRRCQLSEMQKPLEDIKLTLESSLGVFRLVKQSFDNSVKGFHFDVCAS